MANIRSQMKRNRQNAKRRDRNRAVRSELNTRTRRTLEAARAGDAETAAAELRLTQKHIDEAASRNILHRNTAARRKSRLSRQVRSLLGA